MIVQFYANDSANNVLDKSVRFLFSANAEWKRGTSILTPSVNLIYTDNMDIYSANMVYIDQFKRWYTITDTVAGLGKQVEFQLKVEVLMTYRDEIRGISTLIDRQEFIYSPYIADSQLLTRCDRFIDSYNVGTLQRGTGANIVLTVTNGGGTESS